MAGVSVTNLARRFEAPRFPYAKVAAFVLPGWEISLVFVGPAQARALNRRLRSKAYVPNVLSYPAGKRSGEVIICPSAARAQAKSYGMTEKAFVLFLFIHGLLHLKGARHGGTMERSERETLARFAKDSARLPSSPHGTTHRNRNRHRDVPGKAGRRRRAR